MLLTLVLISKTQFVIIIALIILLAVTAWRSGFVETAIELAAQSYRKFYRWLNEPEARRDYLPEKLPQHAFYSHFIQTTGGWLWSVVRVLPIGTDGISPEQWNLLGDNLARLFSLPAGTVIQVLFLRHNNVDRQMRALARIAQKYAGSPLAPLALTQANFFRKQAQQGKLYNTDIVVLIGRKAEQKKDRIPFFKSIIAAFSTRNPFFNIEVKEFRRLADEVLQLRDEFIAQFNRLGGQAVPTPAREAFRLLYHDLNPVRAEQHPAPVVDEVWPWQLGGGAVDERGGCKFGPDTKYLELFPPNPRETVCYSNIDIENAFVIIDGLPHISISLHRLPGSQQAGMVEKLTRSNELEFNFKVSSYFRAHSSYEVDEQLQTQKDRTNRKIRQAGYKVDDAMLVQNEEVGSVRRELMTGESMLGDMGFAVTFSAPNTAELTRRANKIAGILRQCYGMEVKSDTTNPLPIFLSTTPAGSNLDFLSKPVLSRDMAALAPLTHGPRGLAERYATTFIKRADNSLHGYDPLMEGVQNRMGALVGQGGSGKSATLNSIIASLLMRGCIGVSFDYDSSTERIREAVGGLYIDPTKSKGLGLFNITPQTDEDWQPDELTQEGLPKIRIATVTGMLESMATSNDKGGNLSPLLYTALSQGVEITYQRMMKEPPTIDNFIHTFKMMSTAEGNELAARLYAFASNQALGSILNDKSSPLSVYRFVSFDFKNARKNPKLWLVAKLAAINYLERFLSVNRSVPKFFNVDELHAIADDPIMAKSIDLAIRTARKRGCSVMVATQDATDLANENLKAIRASCQFYWLLASGSPETIADALNLTVGERELLRNLQVKSSDSRDCMLLYPDAKGREKGRSAVHLRLQFDPLMRRLCLGAGDDKATADEAMAALKEAVGDLSKVSPRLIKAIQVSGMRDDDRNRSFVSAAD